MELRRIRSYRAAKIVSQGIKRYNGISVKPSSILRNPHYTIVVNDHPAGWIGYRPDTSKKYEVNHLSIFPKFRRRGLAEEATIKILGIIWDSGCRVAYLRIQKGNRASILLARGMGFRRTSRGDIEIYTLRMRQRPVFVSEDGDETTQAQGGSSVG